MITGKHVYERGMLLDTKMRYWSNPVLVIGQSITTSNFDERYATYTLLDASGHVRKDVSWYCLKDSTEA